MKTMRYPSTSGRWYWCLSMVVSVVLIYSTPTSLALLPNPTTHPVQQLQLRSKHVTMTSQYSFKARSTKLKSALNEFEIEACTSRRELLKALLAASAGTSTMFCSRPSFAQEGDSPNGGETTVPIEDWSKIDIMKPPLDDRDYAAYIMPNHLKVILCSDPTTNEGGASMDVHVGACSDPPGVNGLAHFNEHMLFLGTKQYPKEDSFESFLATNGGTSNAYTDSEDTVYHFTMDAETDSRFAEGLSRFGSFFTSPLFTESATGRELNAIESEHAKNIQSDNFRIYQIEKGRQNSEHPHSKFFTGNKQTLLENTKKAGLDLRQELIKFYNQHYSSNQMTLAVVGPQSIDKLKEMVEQAFAEIPNRGVAKPEDEWNRIIPPYGGTSLIPSFKNVVKAVPVQDLRQVTVTWPLVYADENDRTNALLAKQANYVAHLIGHEGPGSLLSYLKRKGWVNSLAAAGGSELSDFEMFEVTVSLTTPGLKAVDNVVEAIFSYLGMIRDRAIPNYIYEEVLQLEELQWRFLPKGAISSYVQSLATALRKYPPSLCVAGPRRLALATDDKPALETSSAPRGSFSSKSQLDFTRRLTSNLVDQLTVDNSLLTILSTSFVGQTDSIEPIYGTQYRCDPIPLATLDRWRNPVKPKSLTVDFPRPNVFIPTEAGLRVKYPPSPVDRFRKRTFEDRLTPKEPPRVIRDDGPDGKWQVYYKPDKTYGQPKAFVILELLTKEVYANAKNAALAALYETCAIDKLGEYAYDAGLAGLSYDVKVLPRGVRLSIGGYNDKLGKFASYVTQKVRDIIPSDENEFERFKDENARGLAAFDVKQPYAHCSYYAGLATQPIAFQYSNKEVREETNAASLDDLAAYVKTLWSSGKAVALIQGNLDENEANSLVQKIEKTLTFKPISQDEYPAELNPLPLPPVPAKATPTRIVFSEPNPSNGNSAVYVTIQDLSEEAKDHVMLELISSIIFEPFYQDLRTQQQLGYIVSSGIRANGKTRYLGFVVQSSVAPTAKLTKEILKFLDKARSSQLEKLGEADLAVYVRSLIDKKTEPDKVLNQEVTRNWAEIGSGRLQFDRVQVEAAALLDVSKQDLLNFWDRIYVNDGRRVLVTESVPRIGVASSNAPLLSTGYASGKAGVDNRELVIGIDDIERFRQDREALMS